MVKRYLSFDGFYKREVTRQTLRKISKRKVLRAFNSGKAALTLVNL